MVNVSLVHERFTELGGSEKVVDVLAQSFEVTRLFVPIADRAGMGLALDEIPTSTSPVQRLYRHDGRYSHLLPLLPLSFRAFDPGASDAVIVSHHAFANRVANHVQDRPVISYVHSPARWMWDNRFARAEAPSPAAFSTLASFSASQRRFDRRAAQRVTTLVANSYEVVDRISRWWGCEAVVIPPPVETTFFTPAPEAERSDSFLYAGRLVGYKRPDIAIEAAQRAGVQLIVAGEGRELERCRALAGPETTFVGACDDAALRDLFRQCRALVFPGLEDFGMIPVEAQATGTPVLGLGQGGIRDTVIDGATGVWVGDAIGMDRREDLIEAFADAMANFDPDAFDPAKIALHAGQFSTANFTERMRRIVDDALR